MRYDRVYNFSAGPAMMPESVLEEIAAETAGTADDDGLLALDVKNVGIIASKNLRHYSLLLLQMISKHVKTGPPCLPHSGQRPSL